MRRRGISLIVLIITIIVVIILAATVILTLSKNNPIEKAKEAKIISSLESVNDSLELYKSNLQLRRLMDDITIDTLIEDGVLKEYIIEETLRPIAVVSDYNKLGINSKFGVGYKNIPEETFEESPSVKRANLNEVVAIDLTDYTMYYIENERVYSLNGVSISDNILSNFERYDADTSEWTFDVNSQTLTKYNGDLTQKRGEQEIGEVIIPNFYNGKRVKKIQEFVFKNNINLTKLTILDGIETIGKEAFYKCNKLKGDLVIPDSVISIGGWAFRDCSSLDGTLRLSKNITQIYDYTFCGCNKLKGDLVIPDSVISIGGWAFSDCSSFSGELNLKNVKSIGYGAFYNCNKLTGNLIIPDSVTSIGEQAFKCCSSLDGNLKLSNSIQNIKKETFYRCNKLKGDLIIPDSVTLIENWAFRDCSSLDGTLSLSQNLTSIGDNAFMGCNSIKGDLVIPDSVISIGGWAFSDCSSFSGLTISNSLQKISYYTFYRCTKITGDIIIPENVNYIGREAFNYINYNNKISSIKILNKDAEIYDANTTFSSNIKIIGYSGSTAEEYATKYNRTFEKIEE